MPARHSAGNLPVWRRAALVLCVLFVLVSLCSLAFIALQADHQHDHLGAEGGCAICAQLVSVSLRLKQGVIVAAVVGAALSLRARGTCAALDNCRMRASTPVSRKVRMNN